MEIIYQFVINKFSFVKAYRFYTYYFNFSILYKDTIKMIKDIPKYIIVENKIKEAIKSREMHDKLPGERVLAKKYGVSYMTLRKAVENLVTQKILYKIPCRGTYVSEPKTIHTMVRNFSDFLESRIM